MKVTGFLITTLLSSLIIGIGCSSGVNSPLASIDSSEFIDLSPVAVTDWDLNGSPTEGNAVLGLYRIFIDPSIPYAEITPVRSVASMDVIETLDIFNFLMQLPCDDCVKLNSIDFGPNDTIILNYGIKHPYDAGNPEYMITGRNRADLHVFNVEGIVQADTPTVIFPSLGETVSPTTILNADGYTGYYKNVLNVETTIQPFIAHFRDYSQGNFSASNPMGFASVTDPPPSGYCVMPMGSDYDNRDYIHPLGSDHMVYNFIIGCTYSITTGHFLERFAPEFRLPQHNKKAASEVRVSISENDLRAGIDGSTARINIAVVDINHNVPVGTALNGMRMDSSVKEIKVEIPGILTEPYTIQGDESLYGTGHSLTDPLRYSILINNELAAPEGAYPGLVKVLDNYLPGSNSSPILAPYDGGARVPPGIEAKEGLFSIDEFATYQVFSIEILP